MKARIFIKELKRKKTKTRTLLLTYTFVEQVLNSLFFALKFKKNDQKAQII